MAKLIVIPTFSASLRLCVSFFLIVVLADGRRLIYATESNNTRTLRKACEYLWSQQADDGGWHSEQYAVMRSGQALTPFVLHTLLEVPESICPRPEHGVERALDFIRAHVDEDGALGHMDPDIIEYPVYSTAYALMCLRQSGTEEDAKLTNQMEVYLRSVQLNEANGFQPVDPGYGGWGFDAPIRPGQPGHMDLAHTRRALQALADCPPCVAVMMTVRNDAQQFLRVVQKHPAATELSSQSVGTGFYDGGFYFSPVVVAANKGREEPDAKHFRSYATATCDGILALLAADVPRNDDRVERAIEWLKKHDDLSYPEGVPTDHPEPWGEAIRFYHYAARAEVYDILDWPGDWRGSLAAVVAEQQSADGSFRNTASPLMKEDDPLLCTALAAIALAHCDGQLSTE